MHLPYNSVRQIVEADDKLFVLSDIGIYEFGLKSGEAEFLTKVNGFSESSVVIHSSPLLCVNHSKELSFKIHFFICK